MPCLSRCVVPGVVNRFYGHCFGGSHPFDSCVNQPTPDSLPPEVFRNVNGVDYSYAAWLNDGRNRLPVVDASNKEPGNDTIGFCHEPEAIYPPKSGVKPLFHCGLGVGSEMHVGTRDTLKVSEPGSLDL